MTSLGWIAASLAGLALAAIRVMRWQRDRARARAAVEAHRADVAEVTSAANAAAVEREAASVTAADRAIPTVRADGTPPTVAATNAAWSASDDQRRAADRVRAKIARRKL